MNPENSSFKFATVKNIESLSVITNCDYIQTMSGDFSKIYVFAKYLSLLPPVVCMPGI